MERELKYENGERNERKSKANGMDKWIEKVR